MTHKCTQDTIPFSKHKGNAAIIFIIIVLFAVGAVIFLNAMTKDPTGPVDQCPWVETNRIVQDSSMINLPQSPQLNLDAEKKISYRITSEDGQNRGLLVMEFYTDGTVVATWTAKYKEGAFEKEFSSTSTGNVDGTKLFEDPMGTDPSKLFFITEGTFLLQAFKQGNAAVGGGDAYVVGWISPDLNSNGTLVLAPNGNKKNTTIYKWGL